MHAQLPAGPRQPRLIQTIGWWTRPIGMLERCRARYGKRFTIRLLINAPLVMLSDPDEIREVFTAPAEVAHPGEGARILEPVVGKHSVLLLDEGPHLSQRKLMLPAFHGERMQGLTEVMSDVAEREVSDWPRGEPVALHSRLQKLTLEIILRAVFGLETGARLDTLRERLTAVIDLGALPVGMLPQLQRVQGDRGQWGRFKRHRQAADEIIFELIADHPSDGDDVLSMLLAARHEDGSPMSPQELRDELMTLLVAGHETTASELAWAFERLVREPRVLRRLVDEVDAGGEEAYLTATIQETLRRRPVLPNSGPRLLKQPMEVGGWSYPEGVALVPNAYLVHHDPAIYPDPYAFRPERFLDEQPGTYTWIPFGGGRRRCLGASFAQLEMKLALRAVLRQCQVEPAAAGVEFTRRRNITLSPRLGARTVLRERQPARQPVAA